MATKYDRLKHIVMCDCLEGSVETRHSFTLSNIQTFKHSFIKMLKLSHLQTGVIVWMGRGEWGNVSFPCISSSCIHSRGAHSWSRWWRFQRDWKHRDKELFHTLTSHLTEVISMEAVSKNTQEPFAKAKTRWRRQNIRYRAMRNSPLI